MMDVDSLLQPISVDAPAGRNLRLDPADLTFRRIAELRSDVDPREDPEGRGHSADWPGVVRECRLALAKQSKDLELATVLTEGLTRVDGLHGLRAGLELMRRLIEDFWDGVHPGLEGNEIVGAIRARELARLGSGVQLLNFVKRCPLATVGTRPFSWSDSEATDRLQEASMHASGSRYRELAEQGALPRADLRAALQLAPAAEIAESLGLLEACAGELRALETCCRKRFAPDEEPSLRELATLLGDIREGLVELARPGEPNAVAAARPSASTATPSAPASGFTGARDAIASRAAALEQLRAVAAYFRAAEPHSPIASLIERAVRWGQMPFEQMLRDVVKSQDALARVWETLGVEPPTETTPDATNKPTRTDGW